MALKLLKVQVNLEVKGDQNDPDDLKERIFESLQMLMESDELVYSLDIEDEEEELEE